MVNKVGANHLAEYEPDELAVAIQGQPTADAASTATIWASERGARCGEAMIGHSLDRQLITGEDYRAFRDV